MTTAKQPKKIVRGYATGPARYPTICDTGGRTKQSFTDECNINNIMARYQKTGAVEHVSKHQQKYGVSTPIAFNEAMNTVIEAQRMFDELPSSIRKKFNQDPAEFLEFVQNEDNADELVELGLANAPAPLPLGSAENPLSVRSDPSPTPPPAE